MGCHVFVECNLEPHTWLKDRATTVWICRRGTVWKFWAPKRPIITQFQASLPSTLISNMDKSEHRWWFVGYAGRRQPWLWLSKSSSPSKACLTDVSGAMYSILYVPLNHVYVGFCCVILIHVQEFQKCPANGVFCWRDTWGRRRQQKGWRSDSTGRRCTRMWRTTVRHVRSAKSVHQAKGPECHWYCYQSWRSHSSVLQWIL